MEGRFINPGLFPPCPAFGLFIPRRAFTTGFSDLQFRSPDGQSGHGLYQMNHGFLQAGLTLYNIKDGFNYAKVWGYKQRSLLLHGRPELKQAGVVLLHARH